MNWGGTVLTNVASTGNLTQLFPSTVTAGTTATTAGSQRRRATEGQLFRAEVYTSSDAGGTIELWDIGGVSEGASNNINTGVTLTNAYLVAQQALGKARLIWSQNFKGDAGAEKAKFDTNTPFMWGLAARFIAAETSTITLHIYAGGGYQKTEICGV
ncbi:hypothetical protein [Caudoviricetes sp.]|nr:hypothetical protein [Caudoviricetes sp.]